MPIEPHSNETQTQWDRGEFAVQVNSATSTKPIGFCQGTESDEAEIMESAESEGVEIEIERKVLKTGREIWTIRTLGGESEPEDEDSWE